MPKHSPSMDFGPSTQQFDSVFPQDALPPGTRLGGYQILEMLGRGGFGIVYLALDSSLQRQVAIKEYLPAETAMRCDDNQVWVKPGADTMAYAAGKTAFLEEAKLLARFDHPALARVHTFWEENRTAYMVMPYYEGQTLAVVLAGMQRPPDEAWLRALLSPLLSALQVLHMAQCLHLDISPDNIIVQRDGRPVLLDFGVASRLATDKTMPLTALLNPAYAPIEQYSESATLPQGPWSDLYALAGVLHFAIAGRPPARATVRAVDDPQRPLSETVAALRERYPGLQYRDSFLAAIDKALAVRPRDRPRNVLDFEQLLDRRAVDAPVRSAATPPRSATPPAPAPVPAAPAAAAASPAAPAPAPAFTASPLPPAAPKAAEMPGGRNEPLFHAPPPREDWFTADPHPTPRPPAKRTRSRAPLWIALVCLLGVGGVGGWAWLQRQPSQARISVTDLPQSVVAAVPKPGAVTPPAPPAVPASGAVPSLAAPLPETAASVPTVAAAAASSTAVAPAPVMTPTASAAAPVSAGATAGVSLPSGTAAPVAPATVAAPKAAPPVAQRAAPSPAKQAKPAVVATTPPAVAAEPSNPRAVCGARTNFALFYCMETQCKRPKYAKHPQCLEFKRDGEP